MQVRKLPTSVFMFLRHPLTHLDRWHVFFTKCPWDFNLLHMLPDYKRKPSEYTYSISDAPISITDSHKDLGVVVSNNLKWSVHIAYCTSKANRMLGFLRRNCTQMTDVRSRRLLYTAIVRYHFPMPARSGHFKALDATLPS